MSFNSGLRKLVTYFIIGFLGMMAITNVAEASPPVLRRGSVGSHVVILQHILNQLSFTDAKPDGMFGPTTHRAVKQYQQFKNITVDGIVGQTTWQHLQADAAKEARKTGVELLHWNEVQHIYTNFKTVTIIDVKTGKQFQARRYYGSHHADTEPLTKKDAAILREVYGGNSWDRRPIIVEVDGRRIAASMNGMPHGQGAITDNGFNGHFCVHFIGSRLHLNGQSDLTHQQTVLEAAGYKSVPSLWLAYR